MSVPGPKQMIRELIAAPSVSCVDPAIDHSNRPVIELLACWLEDLDFRVEITPIPELPGKENLIAVVAAAERFSGHMSGSVAFATEAPYLNRSGLQTVVLGPGHIDQAHQPDEYLGLEQIQPTIDLLGAMIGEFCVKPAEAATPRP